MLRLLLLLALLATDAPSLAAQDHVARRIGEGRAVPSVYSLAQDRTGFLWIGGIGGLFRYDGVEMRHWAPDVLRRWITSIATSADGRVVVLTEGRALFEMTADGAAPVPGLADSVAAVVFDHQSRLWIARGETVSYGDGRGRWKSVPAGAFGGERPRLLAANHEGGVDVATDGWLWVLDRNGRIRRLAAAQRIDAVLPLPDGRRCLLTFSGRVLDVGTDGRMVERLSLPGTRGIALALRGRTIWASFDRYLAALRPGEPPEVLGPADGIESGGALLVDAEGGLWLGTFSGLFQFPEPETAFWNDRHGLPSAHTRFVVRSGETVWVTTWQGTGFLRRSRSGWQVDTATGWTTRGRIHVDGRGALWTAMDGRNLPWWKARDRGIVEVRRGRAIPRHPASQHVSGIARAPGGGFWLATDGGLFAITRDGSVRQLANLPFGGDSSVHAVLHDRAGLLWIASGETICRAPTVSGKFGIGQAWACRRVDGAVDFVTLLEAPSGAIWAASQRVGILCYRDGDWVTLPWDASARPPGVLNLVPSPSGGTWVVGHDVLERVRERPGGCTGWEVLERLSAWHGLPASEAGDLLEEADSTLWITTVRGLVRVPREARFAGLLPPRVALVAARVDSVRVPLDRSLRLTHDRNRLELRFAALSFRDPSLIRYQVRLSPDAPWSDAGSQAAFRWVDLPAGRYHAEVRASLDGRSWSRAAAAFAFIVLPPWYLRLWALTLFALAAVALLWAGYRARVAYLLGLERQRTRIAMDLHDEMGSGLGSIGILAGLLASDNLPETPRELARTMSRTAEELGAALSDIVWSLSPRADTLEELAGRLAEHGERVFPGDDVEISTRFPSTWPSARLSLPLRRNVLLIGFEALYNAARHARATRVTLELRSRGRSWELTVRDDGIGLPDPARKAACRGTGLVSMRRRAEDIGAEITWAAGPGGGTIVSLIFSLRARTNDGLIASAWRPWRAIRRRVT